ncbi:MAG: MATE family efflux transporter, partial [Oscillospiraceae bacterium]
MAEAKANDFLEKERLGKLMVKYCVPCIIALLVATLYNIVDQIFIANATYLGSYGVAASSVVFPLTVVALGLAMMVGDGCCAFVSISLGAKKNDTARRSIGTSVVTLVTMGIVLMLIYLVFQEPILTLFGGRVDAETFRMSKEYFFWIALGIPFYMFSQAMNPIVRSDGSPRFAMASLVIGALINVILDPIFIFACKWGMRGAAIATILGQIVSALMFAGYLFRMKAVKLDRDSFKFRFSLMKKIAPLGMASLLTQISIALSMAVVLSMLKKYGALDPVFSREGFTQIPTAVFGIVIKIYQVVISIAIGLATGCIPIAGYNMGARRYDRVRKLMKNLLTAQLVVGLIATIVFLVFPRQITYVFGGAHESQEYIDFSVKYLRIFMCMTVLSCFNKGVAIFEQALGHAKTATGLSILREIVFGISMPAILPIFMGLDGILYFMPVSDVVTFIVSVLVVAHTVKTLRDTGAEPESESGQTLPAAGAPNARGVVTIGRSYGAGGRSVGKLVAEALGVPYYDSQLLEKAAADSGLSRKFLESMDEKTAKLGAL